jgi:hypothetical protein
MLDRSRKQEPMRGTTLNFSRRSALAMIPVSSSALAFSGWGGLLAQSANGDSLRTEFETPPNAARPRVWWHWMNGNVTIEGIRKDLEWMKRVGIGGLQNFDAALSTPQIVEKRLVYMTPEWKQAFRYTTELSDTLGLELAIAASPGWSETGGPWVPPQDGMKKLVWSETEIEGGSRYQGTLSAPPGVTGPFQDMPMGESQLGNHENEPPAHYGDARVLAFPLPAEARALPLPKAVLSDGKSVDAAILTDGSYRTAIEVPRGTEEAAGYLAIDYGAAQTVRSASVAFQDLVQLFRPANIAATLEGSSDGIEWRRIAEFPVNNGPQVTVSFAPVTARWFRVLVEAKPQSGALGIGSPAPGAATFPILGGAGPVPTMVKMSALVLHGEARSNNAEAKAGFGIVRDYYTLDNADLPEAAGIAPEAVVDLTSKLGADGRLDWTAPPGRWKVLRLGWSLTGTTNHPATAEATGLEVDKFDGEAVARYLEHYLQMFEETVGPDMIGKRGLRALLTDSIEVGASNWTPRIAEQFKRLRGYDLTSWLPALTGVIIGSRAQTDAFLYDFRQTLGDLLAEQHYGTIARVAHEHGLTLYGEAFENGRPSLGDDMAMRRYADIPMAALWTYGKEGPRPTLLADMKGAASVAHIYGQNLAAAESMTSAFAPWAYAPKDLKPFIDLEFLQGINRPVIHTSVHQPSDEHKPGLSLMIFGQHFNRHDSWAEMAKPWVDYMSRSSHLLQQGRYFADAAYFYGEDAPLTALFAAKDVADAPVRYGYDFVNPDVVLDQLEVRDGDLVARSGARYRLLYLGGSSRRMTLRVLNRIAVLAERGATIVGIKPEASPALADDPATFQAVADRLWAGGATTAVGSGRVIASDDVEAALASIGAVPDFDYPRETGDDVRFLHRRLADGDLYFLTNRKNLPASFEARFRVTGKTPEIWRADTGLIAPVSYRTDGEHTVVPLQMLPEDAFFVVFRGASAAAQNVVPMARWRTVAEIGTPWEVSFEAGRGAPETARFASLEPLNESEDQRIRYFSGLATYRSGFDAPLDRKAGDPLLIDLGGVGDVAEVIVNGQSVGVVWKAPYRLDISRAVNPGRNAIEVRVANLWVNRLIGDAQPGATKVAYTTVPTYNPDAPLRPSGLIGPVSLMTPELAG